MTPNAPPSRRLSSQAGCLSRFLRCVTALSLLALQSAPSPLPLAVLSPHHHPPRLIPTSLPTSHFITAVTIPSSPSHHHPPISSPTFHLITILPSHHHPHISSPSSPPPPHSLSTTTCSPLALLAPWTPLPPPGLLLLLSSSTVTYKAH